MTNPTPRDSAQLPPLPDTVAAFRDKGTFTMPEQFYPADVIDAREALRAQAASSPATAVDAVIDAIDWVDNFVARCNGDDRGSNDSVNLIRAALQASRQPQAQQAVAEGAGDEDAARWQFVMDWGNKDFAVCKRVGVTGTCWEPIKTSGPVDDALANKEQRS